MGRIAGVAFDLVGTVIDVEFAHHHGWLHAAAEKIGVILSIEDAIERVHHFIGGPDHKIIEEFFALAGKIPHAGHVAEFLAHKCAHYNDLIETVEIEPRPGFLEVLGELQRCGFRTAIGTADDDQHARMLLERSGLDDFFPRDKIVFAGDVKNQKPAPDCFRETARRMGITPWEQVVFEDSPRGVQSGVAAGSRVIGMPVYAHEKAVLRLRQKGAAGIYTDWKEICVPELLEFLDG